MGKTRHTGKAVVTGASSGIGAVYADRLAKRGYDLILVARDQARLSVLSKRISAETGRKVEFVPADLTQKPDLLRVEEILKNDSEISLLVNNAGIADAKSFLESDVEKLERMISLNVTVLTRLAHAVTPSFAKRNSGAIINIASVVALAPGLVGGTYSATKAFVLNLTQAMHQELKDKGIQVQAVLPGATSTELWERAGVNLNNLPKEIVMSTEDMVDASLAGFDHKELVTIPSLPNEKDWEALETARLALGPNLSLAKPAARYSRQR